MTIEFPESHHQFGVPEEMYPYRDTAGESIAAVYRFEGQGGKKEIRPYCLERGAWVWPAEPVLYELDGITARKSEAVIIVEGEKCANALSMKGFLATTSMGGSNAADKSDWSTLKGRRVIIWPDNDVPGHKYARKVAKLCLKAGAEYVGIVPINSATIQKALGSAGALETADALLAASGGKSTAAAQSAFTGNSAFSADIGPNASQIAVKALGGAPCDTLPTGWDVADATQEGWNKDQIQALLDQAERYSAVSSSGAVSAFSAHSVPAMDTASARGANDNWPEPDKSFLNEDNTPPAFPLEIFPPQVRDWLAQSASCTSSPVDYVAGTLLTTCASLIGASRRITPWGTWSEPCVLWSILVGSPSSGKSPAMDPVLSAVSKIEANGLDQHKEALLIYETDKLEAELAHGRWVQNVKSAGEEGFAAPIMPESAIAPEVPCRKRVLIRDATSEALLAGLKGHPKGFLSVRDELSGWFASMDRYSSGKGGDRAIWLEAFGGRPYTIDRVKNGGEPLHISSLAISVLGGIQPDRLETCLLKGDDDGLSARFLYFAPSSVPRERPEYIPDDRVITQITRRLDALEFELDDQQALRPRILPLSAEAAELFRLWWKGLVDRFKHNPRMAGWWGKAQAQCLRLALTIECINWAVAPEGPEPTEISATTLQSIIDFMEAYAGPMAERAHGVASKSGGGANTRTLALHIQDTDFSEFSVRDLQRSGPMRNLTAKEIKDACFDLVGYGWLMAAPVRQGTTAGQTQGRFLVNPAL